MKRRSAFFLFLFISLVFAGTAQAIPTYYTFEGIFDSEYNDWTDFPDLGVVDGTTLSYTVMIDLDNIIYQDSFEARYYAEYIFGDDLLTLDGRSDERTTVGWASQDLTFSDGYDIRFGTDYLSDVLRFRKYESSLDYIAVGDGFITYDVVGDIGRLRMLSTLTEIKAVPSPEPSTLLLIGTGVFGFAVPRIRKRLKKTA